MWRTTATHPRRLTFRMLLGAVVTIVLANACHAEADFDFPLDRAPGKIDDGWRKTASGWEHVNTWDQPPVLANIMVVPERNYFEVTKHDLHPLAWALLMLFISLASLTFLPGSQPDEAGDSTSSE